MKKLFIALLALLLISAFSVSSFAATEENYMYNIGSVTVIFDENDTWDASTREAIAHRLVYGDDTAISTYNLLCNMFGHKYETKGVTTVTHCAQSSQPRCLEEVFNISLCSRCGDQLTERTGYCYIYCCP